MVYKPTNITGGAPPWSPLEESSSTGVASRNFSTKDECPASEYDYQGGAPIRER